MVENLMRMSERALLVHLRHKRDTHSWLELHIIAGRYGFSIEGMKKRDAYTKVLLTVADAIASEKRAERLGNVSRNIARHDEQLKKEEAMNESQRKWVAIQEREKNNALRGLKQW